MQWPITVDQPDDSSPDQWALAKAIAVDWVWALSGRKFGQWDVAFRPEWTRPPAGCGCWPPSDLGFTGWVPQPSTPVTSTTLPGPVASVTQVLINDAPFASGGYTLIGDDLIRTDGGSWPAYQDTALPVTADKTWQITYLRGLPVPLAGQYAAGVLAREQVKRMNGDKTCRLPNNTTAVTRNGTSVSLDAKQPQLGFTNLQEVDQWCRLVNPKGRQSEPQVWSPDLDPSLRRPIPVTTT